MNEPAITYHRGQSSGAYVVNTNRSAVITLTLLQTSPSNDRLQLYLDRLRAGETNFSFNFLIQNNAGGESCSAQACVVETEPALTYSSSGIENREWRILSGNCLIKHATSYSQAEADG